MRVESNEQKPTDRFSRFAGTSLFPDKQPRLTDEMIEEEANLRYGEITGGQYLRSRPHDIAVFKSGAKWARNYIQRKEEK